MFYVYVLQCIDGTFYTGITTDLARRVQEHNGELSGGAKYTRSRRPVTLVYNEEHISRSAAQRREAEIKKMTRQEKLLLISMSMKDIIE